MASTFCLALFLAGQAPVLGKRNQQGQAELEAADNKIAVAACGEPKGQVSNLTALLEALGPDDPLAENVDKLDSTYENMGNMFKEMGFGKAGTILVDNSKMVNAGTCSGHTVFDCLVIEVTEHTLQKNGKPAKINDPSPAMGLIWTSRILGFMGDMFAGVSQGSSMKDAASKAMDARISPAFSSGWMDKAKELAVRHGIINGVPDANKEVDFLKQLREDDDVTTAKCEMGEFATHAIRVADAIWESIKEHKLDDSKKTS